MDRIEYNGWTNYATWKVNLEMLDGLTLEDIVGIVDDDMDKYDLSLYLKDWCMDYVDCDMDSFAGSCVRYFLDDVDWVQLANHLIEEYKLESATDES